MDLELVVVVVLAEGERRGDEEGPDSWRNEDRVLFDFMADLREEMQVLLMSLWLQVSAAAMREWEREREGGVGLIFLRTRRVVDRIEAGS